MIAGHSASFSASATAVPTPSVQWQVSTDGGTTFTNVGGATSPTYSLVPTLAQNGNQYRAAFTNPVGTVYSSAALLTVNPVPPLSITTTSLPAGQVYSSAHKVKYSATLTASSGNPPYQWKVAAGSLPNGLKLSKNTGAITGKATFAGSFTFTVEVLDKKGPGPLHLQNTATAAVHHRHRPADGWGAPSHGRSAPPDRVRSVRAGLMVPGCPRPSDGDGPVRRPAGRAPVAPFRCRALPPPAGAWADGFVPAHVRPADHGAGQVGAR